MKNQTHIKTMFALIFGAILSVAIHGRTQSLVDLFSGRVEFKVQSASLPMVFPSIVKGPDGAWWAYSIGDFEHTDDDVLLYKSTDDGASWQFKRTVLKRGSSDWNNVFDTFPDVLRVGDTWYLVTECKGTGEPGAISLATSSDGLIWNRGNQPILRHGGGHERNNIGTPLLRFANNTWYLFFHSYGRSSHGGPDDVQICLAKGPSLTSLTRVENNPIIRTERTGPASGTIGRRNILKQDGYYFLVAEVSTDDVNSFSASKWSSAVWRSANLESPWEACPANPILPQTGTGNIRAGFGFDGPTFFRKANGTIQVFFRGIDRPSGVATLVTRNSPANNGPWAFEAESPSFGHEVGRREADGWGCNVLDRQGFALYGPYTTAIAAGGRTASFRILIDNNSANNDEMARLDVRDANSGLLLAQRSLTRRQWNAANRYQDFDVVFRAETGQRLEFRLYHRKRAALRIDKVVVR